MGVRMQANALRVLPRGEHQAGPPPRPERLPTVSAVACPPACSLPSGYMPTGAQAGAPLTLATEFKRPTPLPAKLQAVVDGAAAPGTGRLPLSCAVLTANGEKEVIVGQLLAGAKK